MILQSVVHQTDEIDEKVKAYVLDYQRFPCGVAVVQFDDSATLLWANPAFYKIIGHAEEFQKHHGKRMNDIIIDDFYHMVQKRTKSEDYDAEWDLRLRAADGSIRWIHDMTAETQLEQKIEMQSTLHNCIEPLFTAGTTEKTSRDAYYDILNQLKSYYQADGAFFYKFIDGTCEVEAIYKLLADGVKSAKNFLTIAHSRENISHTLDATKALSWWRRMRRR